MEEQIALLEAVKTTLESIPLYVVNGTDAMDKLEGCRNAVSNVIAELQRMERKATAQVPDRKEEATDGR